MKPMTTSIDPSLEHGGGLKSHVQNAARFLESRVGDSAVNPRAEWRLSQTTNGSQAVQVQVSDEGVSAEATFAPHEIANYPFAKDRLYGLWFDLLGKRLKLHDDRIRELAASDTEG